VGQVASRHAADAGWAFNRNRQKEELPREVEAVLAWFERKALPM
jgi:hypothetical protein